MENLLLMTGFEELTNHANISTDSKSALMVASTKCCSTGTCDGIA